MCAEGLVLEGGLCAGDTLPCARPPPNGFPSAQAPESTAHRRAFRSSCPFFAATIGHQHVVGKSSLRGLFSFFDGLTLSS